MKKISFSLLLQIIITGICNAQGFVSRTNEVYLNFKNSPITAPIAFIEWTSPVLESSFSQQNALVLEASVRSELEIKEIKLRIKSSYGTNEKNIPLDENKFSKNIKQNLTLLDGENVIEILAENMSGSIASSTRSVIVGKDAQVQLIDANRKDYALVFATDRYDHWDNLVNPINDARTIADILKTKYGFQTEIVENATHEEVLAKIYDYNSKKFNVQDQLFIFFAGHGYFDETLGEGYIVASNSLLKDRGKSSYISHTTLRHNLDNIKVNHIFLMMDVCFGGTFDPVLARNRNVDVYADVSESEILLRKLSKMTRKYLTSGGKTYVSDGVRGKHSPFAARFIEALRTIGDGKDRILTLTELQPYFLKLATEPRSGSFGKDEPNSDFVFVAKN